MIRKAHIVAPLVAGNINPAENVSRITGGIRADHITSALDEARKSPANHYKEFRQKQREWAVPNLPQLVSAGDRLIELSLRPLHGDIDKAQAALTGLFLGTRVVRGLIQEGIADVEVCRRNLGGWSIAERGIVYDGNTPTQAVFTRVLSASAAEGLEQVGDLAARATCGAVIGLTLISPDLVPPADTK